MGFVNCSGWWSREVVLKLVIGLKRFVLLGLAEMFLQKDEEVSVHGMVAIEKAVGGLVMVWDCWRRVWS